LGILSGSVFMPDGSQQLNDTADVPAAAFWREIMDI
jgi:hypothetical protein